MTLLSKIVTSILCLCSTFKIQLYWEDGYNWQERDYEFTRFCWTRNYVGIKSWGFCYNYGNRIGLCWPDAVYISRCAIEDTRQMWTFVHLRGGQFQIKAPTQPMCLERINNNDLRMRWCDSNNSNQRFSGSTSSSRFSISHNGQCLGQKHHPKNGEVIEMESCGTLRQDDTLYWEKMWG